MLFVITLSFLCLHSFGVVYLFMQISNRRTFLMTCQLLVVNILKGVIDTWRFLKKTCQFIPRGRKRKSDYAPKRFCNTNVICFHCQSYTQLFKSALLYCRWNYVCKNKKQAFTLLEYVSERTTMIDVNVCSCLRSDWYHSNLCLIGYCLGSDNLMFPASHSHVKGLV